MLYLVAGIIGFILGLFFMAYGIAIKIVGTIRVDSSNEDGPYLFLELDTMIITSSRFSSREI